jgi:WD40 repeat protein
MWVQWAGTGVEALAYSPDGRALFVGDASGTVTEWDVSARTKRKLFATEYGVQYGMFCAAGGRFLVTRSHTPVLWDRGSGTEYVQIDPSKLGKFHVTSQYSMRTLPGDDTRLLIENADATAIRTWNTATRAFGPVLCKFGAAYRFSWFDVSPDGGTVALLCDQRPNARLFDLTTGKQSHALDTSDGADRIRFSPDGKTLAVMCAGRLFLGALSAPKVVQVAGAKIYPGLHFSICRPFAFHPTAPVFAALNNKGVATLFDIATLKPLTSLDFALGRHIQALCFSPDGLTCAVGGSNKRFAVFDVDV